MGMLLLAAVFMVCPNAVHPNDQLGPAVIDAPMTNPVAPVSASPNQPPQHPLAKQNDNRIPDSQQIDFFIDLNADGIDDADQSDRMISILNYDGSLTLGLGIETTDKAIGIQTVASVNPSTLPEPFFSPEEMAYGLLRYKISVPSPGQQVCVIVYLGNPSHAKAPWLRYDSVLGWEDISSKIRIDPDGTHIARCVTDGGAGDSDGAVNGIIVDQVGPLTIENTAISDTKRSAADGVETTTCFIQDIGLRTQ